MLGFVVGSFLAQFVAAWAYWRVRGPRGSSPKRPEWLAATADGIGFVLVASGIYVPMGVQFWLLGSDAPWGVSVFMAVCMGLAHAVLFRGRPWARWRAPTLAP